MHFDIDGVGAEAIRAPRNKKPAAKPAPANTGHLPDDKPAMHMVPAKQVVHGIFAPCGRKLGFVVYGKFDMNRFIALHQWGENDWVKSDALAKRWNVTLVVGERAWLRAIGSAATPPTGIPFTFL